MDLYYLYRIIRKSSLIHNISKRSALQRIKYIFKPNDGLPKLKSGTIHWNNYSFYFTASYSTFYKASTKGIENQICRVILNNVDHNEFFIDVGANYGFISLVASFKVDNVISFEINPVISNVLKKTITKNKLDHKIDIRGFGVGDKHNRDIYLKYGSKELKSKIATLDSFEWNRKIGAIKIDIDGEDYRVLLGAKKILKKHSPIIIIEMNDNIELIYDTLLNTGYEYYYTTDGKEISPYMKVPNLVASIDPIIFSNKIETA